MIAALLIVTGACAFPAEPEPFPPQDEDFSEIIADLNEEAERRMDEMMRENEELFEQFSTDDDSLRLTGIGGG